MIPARSAASTFSLTPPIGSTSPRRLISPVIATSLLTGRPVSSDVSATKIATPALGPSFGVAPAGTWMWMSDFSNTSGAIPSSCERALTSDSAACALSFITSPNCPVRISLPAPGIRVASMNRMSPPTGVQASPVATPGTPLRIATSASNLRGPRIAARSSGPIVTLLHAAFGDAHRDVAQHRADLALEVAHARFARVVVDDRHQRVVADLALFRLEPCRFELARDEVAPRDLQLFLGGVARKLDDLHAVAQRSRNRVEHVRRADEHHARQVERHREVVVAERRVLLGVEHLEQRRSRVAVKAAGAELVDLVQHHHAVARAGLAQVLDDVARQRADVGAPVAADLGLVVDAAEAHADELAPGRLGDALAERRLAHAGRPDEAQDRALARRIELPHREVFEDALLDLLEPVVVVVEDAPRLGDVDRRLGLRPPTAARSASRDTCGSSSTRRRPRASARGASIPCAPACRPPPASSLRSIAFSSSATSAAASSPSPSSFWIWRICSRSRCLRLLSSIEPLRALVDLARDLQHLDAVRQELEQLVEPRLEVEGLEQRLLLRGADVHQSRDEVGETRGTGDRRRARRRPRRAPAAAAAGSRARAASARARGLRCPGRCARAGR